MVCHMDELIYNEAKTILQPRDKALAKVLDMMKSEYFQKVEV